MQTRNHIEDWRDMRDASSIVGSFNGSLSRWAASAVAVASLVWLVTVSPVANLIGNFGLSIDTAASIVALVTSGGFAIDFLFPWVLPFVGTLQAIIIAGGTGAAVGW
jgi:hypothetical protein